jgi:preprotein translocase subunit SecE
MIKKIKDFLREVKIEIKKVVFPSRAELIGSTWVVIIVVLIISVFLGIVDFGLSRLVGLALR